MKRHNKAFALACLVVVFWSTIGSVFNRALLRFGLSPAELLLFSLPVALAVTALFLTIERPWDAVTATTRRELAWSALVGCINPFLYYTILLRAYQVLPAQEATTINYLWPIVLVVLSAIFLKQPVTGKTIAGLVFGFAGVYLIVTKGAVLSVRFENSTGVLLALASTVIWASFWILNLKDRRDAAAKLFLNFLFGFAFTFGAWIVVGERRLPPLGGLACAAYVGVFEMGLTFFLWLKALAYAERTAEVANLIFLAPFLALGVISVVVGETILPSTIAGLVLIVAGIFVQKRGTT